ncbi:cytochrome P450 CYP736A12 [Arachis ipaensis]|uniref:cytochrome P450 CYP736A12 n=1 Tax=Arachis ipaensis TaxID=130454 RepID=UPI0007AF96D6|nr:cytochrome P450 CYP736A12 [Arachis ipaensis]XP_025655990.1 cytochrome P450 CYP736A12 [Arachis hypogaea]
MLPIIPAWFLLVGFILFILSTTILFRKQSQQKQKQPPPPPGPPAVPVVGHLHILGELPHRTLETLSKKHGPIMSLRLGQVPTIVISSPEVAELFLKKHDTVFASRPLLEASKYFSYGYKGMIFAEYGPYWRNMRKVCTLQLLSASKVESFAPLRKLELGKAVKTVAKAAEDGKVVNLSEVVHSVMEDVVYKMVLGCNKDDKFDLKGLIHEMLILAGKFNVTDFVPWLGPLDLQGLRRNFKKLSKEVDEVLEKIIKDHEHASSNAHNNNEKHGNKDFVDILLSQMHQPIDPYDEQNHVIDRTNIKAIVLDMIAAAFDTSATVILWALSELLRNPRVMKKLQEELRNVVGMNKLVEEVDLPKLSYLDMVIKEALRLHPAGTFITRKSMKDIVIHNYYIKKSSEILVNLWAIGRDPKVWSNNALEFYPERFLNKNVDLRGYDFELIPFGSGRRGCPGIQLGLVTVKLVVSQFVHCFDWELPWGMSPNELDMSEKYGITVPRVKDLLAVPAFRLLRILAQDEPSK